MIYDDKMIFVAVTDEGDHVDDSGTSSEPADRYQRLRPFVETLDLDDPDCLELIVEEIPHNEKRERNTASHKCEFCESWFPDIATLRLHLNLHATICCWRCEERFLCYSELTWHMRAVHGEDPQFEKQFGTAYYCRFCKIVGFPAEDAAFNHVERCHRLEKAGQSGNPSNDNRDGKLKKNPDVSSGVGSSFGPTEPNDPAVQHQRLRPFVKTIDLDDPACRLDLIVEEIRCNEELLEQDVMLHKCEYCATCFLSLATMRLHLDLHATIRCLRCEKRFLRGAEHSWHLRAVHGVDPQFEMRFGSAYYCRLCKVVGFPTENAAFNHVERCHTVNAVLVELMEQAEDIGDNGESEIYGPEDANDQMHYCERCDVFICGKGQLPIHNQRHLTEPTTATRLCRPCLILFGSEVEWKVHCREIHGAQ